MTNMVWLTNISPKVALTDPLCNNFKANLFNGTGSTAGGRKAASGSGSSDGAELFSSFEETGHNHGICCVTEIHTQTMVIGMQMFCLELVW
jgi:hypothetical protein